MKKQRMSPAQKRVLEVLSGGGWVTRGHSLVQSNGEIIVDRNYLLLRTTKALLRHGWIQFSSGMDMAFIITDAGRDALEQHLGSCEDGF